MNRNEKRALVPRLRFPEFRDSGDWKENMLGELSTPIAEQAGVKKYTLLSVTAGIGLISQLEKFGREIAGSAYKNYYVIKKGDFAYNKSSTKQFPEGSISMLTKYEKGAVPNSIFTCFRITDKECYPKFFDHLFQFNTHGTWLRQFIAIGARAHGSLNIDDQYLWEMPIVLPTLPEQQKIADCLSSLDELITAEDNKLAALKMHKKGLMQKLFPAKGETLPEWRFPEFRDSGDWKEKKLGEVIAVPKKEKITDATGYTPLTVSLHCRGVKENPELKIKISDTGRPYYVRKAGELIIGRQNFHNGSIAIVPKELDGGITSNAISSFEIQNINQYFLYSYLSCEYFYKPFGEISIGTGQKEISEKQILQITIFIPTLPEQQKIADCLSSLDELISAQGEKIQALKAHKKGLMQGLFPSTAEAGR